MISWNGSGKRRPVLILHHEGEMVTVFQITTKYESKSQSIKNNYFPIEEWQYAGLHQPSYIDTIKALQLTVDAVDEVPMGQLSEGDTTRLRGFLAKRGYA